MAIDKYYVSRPKEGYPYDRKENKYFSWGYDIWLGGQRLQERGFLTRAHAEHAVITLKESHKNGRLGITDKRRSPRLIELLQKKLDTMAPGPDRTRAKRVFKYFLGLLPLNIKVVEIKTVHLKSYHEARRADGVSNATIKREMVPVIEVLNNAGQYDDSLENYRPPKKPTLTISKKRRTVVIPKDVRRRILLWLLRPCGPDEDIRAARSRRRVGLFMQFSLLTASRPGEVAKLRRDDVDLDAGTVIIHGTKTEKRRHSARELLITPTMRSIILERLQLAEGEYLFTRNGQISDHWRKQLKAACEASGAKYGKKDPEGIIFYTARHTATTTMLRSNRVDLKTAGQFTGHSDQTMTMIYSHSNRESLAIAGEVIEENMGSALLDGEFLESKAVAK